MTVILFKDIKPARMKEQAIRLQLLSDLRAVGETIKKEDYGAITRTWKHQPEIQTVLSLTGPGHVLVIGTDDEIFRYVSEGTEEHIILPVRAKALRFRRGYLSKTMPGVIGSSAGGPYGETVFSQGVIHPGTKPRNFDEEIVEKREAWFKRQMEASMRKAARKSGWSQE